MAVYKEPKTNTWRVIYRYTDWNGERKQSQKRGFQTKREAQSWEREQLNKLGSDLDMTFRSFVEHYEEDRRSRIKDSTWESKEHIIRTKLLPYFGKLKMSSITPQQIVRWQNELINYRDKDGAPYSPVYLKSIQNQISAIFNHAVRYYNLKENPCKKAGSMGKKKNREMAFWTKEEYLQFIDAMMDKPLSFYAFEMLYWCGIREGELLALTPADFDFDKRTVTINKTFQHTGGKDIITPPKTEKSNRTITMPRFLADEMQEYLKMQYDIGLDDRMFPVTKSYLYREMQRGCQETGVKRIRIHDLRHSHISLLIDQGFSAVAIADRVGHESIDITYNYAHLFPSKQAEMADKLDMEGVFKMSSKNRDEHNRWRNKTVAFRVSPEEDAQIERYVQLSGLTKQDYITRRLTHKDVVVQGNPRVFKALRNQLAEVLAELQRIETGDTANDELLDLIEMIADILGGMKEEFE